MVNATPTATRKKTASTPSAAPSVAPASAPKSGPQKAMEKLGLLRDIDLALHLPLRYEDETRITPIAALRDGDVGQVLEVCEPRGGVVVDHFMLISEVYMKVFL